MAEIIEKSSVSSSSFQNIFRAKDGVLTELVQFMFENQFSMARSAASTMLPPVYVYAVETAIQMTLTELNENLRRIARERSNVDRNLRPKKWHTGYVVVSSTEKAYRYKVDRQNWKTVMLWETVLETPYFIDFTEEQAREQTKELTGSVWLVGRLGINASYGGEYEDMLAEKEWSAQQKREMNIMLKRRLRANYKTGYWEVIFSHTKPLGVVPADMRAR